MNRRRFLRTVGATGIVGATVGIAGCGQFTDESNAGQTEACGPYEPTVSGSTGWQTVGGDPAGTGVVPASETPEPPLSLDWTYILGGMAGAVQPVATAGRVYAHEYDSLLCAVDATSGEKVWEKRVESPHGPLAIGDDVVVALAESTVLGLNPETGETRWTVSENYTGLFRGGPVVVDETVYVSTELSLLALDLADGTVRWKHTTGEETVATPAIVGETVYYGDYDTYVYALDAATGEEKWRVKTNAHIDCNVTVADGTVFAGNPDGIVHAIDAASGEHTWTYDVRSDPNVLATDGSHVYVQTDDQLYAVEATTGVSCWSTESTGAGVAVGDGCVYTPLPVEEPESRSLPGVLNAATGEKLAKTQGEFESRYARYYKGSAVVDGAVYASGVDEDGISLARFS
ncbi:PQQ-binding-like beta-propeller repeat protein [Haloprofundus halobius]|uniref:outer membrane protein assembly factor BamB family protein n=1 Tax=Haloprofundus halobius TaxID=2876194 RepID=UPI001CCEA070|nr:PQQ-binding-like beta-propeller repeat protein [Haloprofundus halobius]